MKLSPPGSSSDLELARTIARRLHQRAFAPEAAEAKGPAAGASRGAEPGRRRPAAPPLPVRPAPPPVIQPAASPEPELRLDTSAPPVEADERSWSEPPRIRKPAPWGSPGAKGPEEEEDVALDRPEPVIAAPDTSGGAEAEDDALAELTREDRTAAEPEELGRGVPPPEEPSEPGAPALEPPVYEEPQFEEAQFEEPQFEEPGVSPEDLIGGPIEAQESWPEETPLEPEIAAAVDGDTSPEDLVEVVAPSWDEAAETCLTLAGARGAMLVDAAGQVLSARGDWPNPGPEAIAGRLVAMMERALRDSPTRSVSAPLAGQHLTAWRVPLGDSLLTAVFIGDVPLRAEVRPSIDDEIRRAAGI